MEDGQYAAISYNMGLARLYLRNTRNLHYEEATKIKSCKGQTVLQGINRFKMEQTVIDLL